MQLAWRDVGRRFQDDFGWNLQFAGGKMSKWPSSLLSSLVQSQKYGSVESSCCCVSCLRWKCGGWPLPVEGSAATSPFLQCTCLVQRIGGRTNINSEDVNNYQPVRTGRRPELGAMQSL
jgi:hypothetical protein